MSRVQRLLNHWGLLVVLFLFSAVRVYVLFRYHVPAWDEAVYIGMGKYIYSLGAAGLWEQIRPPLLPLVLGALWSLGLNPLFWGEVIMILVSLGVITATYLIALKHDRRVALLAAVFLAISPTFVLYSGDILTHMPAVLLIELAMLIPASWAKGSLAALAALCRFPSGLSLFLHRWSWQLFIAAALVSVPFFFANYAMYHPYTGTAFDATARPLLLGEVHQFNLNEAQADGVMYYLLELMRSHPLLLLFLIVGIPLMWKDDVFRFFVAFAAYYTLIPNKQERFMLEFLPFAAIIAACGLMWYVKRVKCARAVLLMLVVAVFPVVLNDVTLLSYRSAEKPPIVSEYYENPLLQAPATVLSADPVPAAYSNAHIIPYYFFVQDTPAVVNEWEQADRADLTVWTESAFPCSTPQCILQRTHLRSSIAGTTVFNKSFGDRTYEIIASP